MYCRPIEGATKADGPFGTFPFLKDPVTSVTLGDSSSIVMYLAKRYPGPATPTSLGTEAVCLDMWANQQDYYSFVISPLHDYNNPAPQKNGRNLRLVDTRADGDEVRSQRSRTRQPLPRRFWSC